VTLHEGAHFELGGVTIGGGSATREIVTRVNHAEPNATSNQVVRSVHWGTATGNFLGRLAVARDAQKTDAAQNFRAILLNRGASANAKPELEIFADDVKCAHGAAIGQLDQAAAYYMAARGIPPEAARKLLVQAFIADALAAIEDRRIADRMLERALEQLDGASL
jgi:Fe-S cluster assembly protein SufD